MFVPSKFYYYSHTWNEAQETRLSRQPSCQSKKECIENSLGTVTAADTINREVSLPRLRASRRILQRRGVVWPCMGSIAFAALAHTSVSQSFSIQSRRLSHSAKPTGWIRFQTVFTISSLCARCTFIKQPAAYISLLPYPTLPTVLTINHERKIISTQPLLSKTYTTWSV